MGQKPLTKNQQKEPIFFSRGLCPQAPDGGPLPLMPLNQGGRYPLEPPVERDKSNLQII
jgi:hypothetical protein